MGAVLQGMVGQPQKHWLAGPFITKDSSSPEPRVWTVSSTRPRSCRDPPGLTGHKQAVAVLEAAGQPPVEQHGGHDPFLQEQRPSSHTPALKETRNAV